MYIRAQDGTIVAFGPPMTLEAQTDGHQHMVWALYPAGVTGEAEIERSFDVIAEGLDKETAGRLLDAIWNAIFNGNDTFDAKRWLEQVGGAP